MNRTEEPKEAPKAAPEKKVDPAVARAAERVKRAKIEESCYEVLEIIRVPNEDGSGKTVAQISEESGLKDEELYAVLDALSLYLEQSTAPAGLVYHVRPGVPAEPTIVVPPAPPPPPAEPPVTVQ